MTDTPFRSATALAADLRAKRIGCRELLELYLGRVERYNPALNAIIATDLPGARRRADEADAALARGEIWGPLHGVPMTIKESFDVAGLPTTWGLPEYKNARAERDALAVARYRAAGAVLFGKSNVPTLLADWQSYNPVYGTTNNPWDVRRSPGGSSGGSAAALAAGLTGLETGSDIGASIRNPAHYCGVYGHKPTYGICPPRGHALPGYVAAADISVIGPLARSAADLEVALDVMAGPDEIDAAGWRLALAPPRHQGLAAFRVGIMLSDPVSEVDQAVQARLQTLADFLAKQGTRVSDRARPDLDTAEVQRVYIQLLRAATSSRQSAELFGKNLEIARGLAADDDGYYARMVRANVLAHRDWLAGNEQRHRMRLKWAAFFQDYDLLLCPAAASAAFPHDQAGERHERTIMVNNHPVPTTDQLFWAGYSCLFYLPSTVAPIGLTAAGLPVGVQIIGPQFGDRTCLAFARLLEQAFGGFVAPPGYA
jgi:amidase